MPFDCYSYTLLLLDRIHMDVDTRSGAVYQIKTRLPVHVTRILLRHCRLGYVFATGVTIRNKKQRNR